MDDLTGSVPDRELSLDVLGNLDMCRLEALGGQHSKSLSNLGKLDVQRLSSLGNLESLSKLDMQVVI